jgi:hypothetical protein
MNDPAAPAIGTILDREHSTVYMGELTIAQVVEAARWVEDEKDFDQRVRLYMLADGSVDVHQGDDATNIDPDGRNNG